MIRVIPTKTRKGRKIEFPIVRESIKYGYIVLFLSEFHGIIIANWEENEKCKNSTLRIGSYKLNTNFELDTSLELETGFKSCNDLRYWKPVELQIKG